MQNTNKGSHSATEGLSFLKPLKPILTLRNAHPATLHNTTIMDNRLKGTLCGIAAAVSYGTNPLGALHLFHDGLRANSVLFYRCGLAAVLLGLLLLAQRRQLRVTLREGVVLVVLGLLFGISSLTYYSSFLFMDAGVASTILFVYPVMVAVIMAACFGEKISGMTVASIVLALSGIALLYRGDGGAALSTTGVVLVMISSLTYALYIVVVNKSSVRMSAVKLNFYVLLVSVGVYLVYALAAQSPIQPLTTPWMWANGLFLALFPTIISLVMMVIAVHNIGSTPTAIMGALEPLTAVVIGVMVFGEHFTPRLGLGIALILVAVLLNVAGKSFSPMSIVRRVSHAGTRLLHKTWRWK